MITLKYMGYSKKKAIGGKQPWFILF